MLIWMIGFYLDGYECYWAYLSTSSIPGLLSFKNFVGYDQAEHVINLSSSGTAAHNRLGVAFGATKQDLGALNLIVNERHNSLKSFDGQ